MSDGGEKKRTDDHNKGQRADRLDFCSDGIVPEEISVYLYGETPEQISGGCRDALRGERRLYWRR